MEPWWPGSEWGPLVLVLGPQAEWRVGVGGPQVEWLVGVGGAQVEWHELVGVCGWGFRESNGLVAGAECWGPGGARVQGGGGKCGASAC